VTFKAPYFSRDELREYAEECLGKRHSDRQIPVPVETIIEQIGIDIVPTPGIQFVCDVDAYTTWDLKWICVEEFVYLHRPTRYRFSLAHELGHIEMHAALFKSYSFHTATEWKEFVSSIDEREYRFLEFHANEFAGHFLVPRMELFAEVKACKSTVSDVLGNSKPDPDVFRDFVAECVGQRFEVSPQVALRRMEREGITT
jgi:Zn-dependent peptidase ImmA (M78 family)